MPSGLACLQSGWAFEFTFYLGIPLKAHQQPHARWPGRRSRPARCNGAMRKLLDAGFHFHDADVTDPDRYEEFKSLAAAAIADHGGRYLVRGGAMQSLEGERRSRVILVEFPTYAAALAFYDSDAYQKARQVRLRSSTASMVVMDGISDT